MRRKAWWAGSAWNPDDKYGLLTTFDDACYVHSYVHGSVFEVFNPLEYKKLSDAQSVIPAKAGIQVVVVDYGMHRALPFGGFP